METPFDITLLMVLTVMAGISAQVLGEYLKIPSIVFLLAFGMLLGRDGLEILEPKLLGDGLEVIVSLSVALILFEGGLQLNLREVGKISGSLRNLITIGTVITLVGGGVAAHVLAEFPWTLSFLYAALVVVTGPTVIGPLLKQVKVDRQVSTLLEGEGVLIDPVGAITAVLVLNIVISGDADLLSLVGGLVLRLGIGALVGGLGGWFLAWFLKQAYYSLSEGLKNLVVLAGLWDLYEIAQLLQDESGLMATVVAGMVLGASSVPEIRFVRRFKTQLTMLAVSVLFILLSADLSLSSIFALGWGSVFAVLVLMLIVRPINVWICTWKSQLNWRQKLFVSWIGPKGIVSASVASLFAIVLQERGITGGDAIKALVFLTIIMTVMIQGLTAGGVASLLRLNPELTTGVVIVGSNPLARLIARLIQERGQFVVLIDSDPEVCQLGEAENLQVMLSSEINTEALEKTGLDSMGTFLALTSSTDVNFLLAQQVVEDFDPPRVLALFRRSAKGKEAAVKGKGAATKGKAAPSKLKGKGSAATETKVQPALTFDLSLQEWNQILANGEAKLVEATLTLNGFGFQQAYLQALIDAGSLVPLLVERDTQIRVARAGGEWQAGDRITCLVKTTKIRLLQWISGEIAPSRLTLDKLPKLREIPIPAVGSVPAPMGSPT